MASAGPYASLHLAPAHQHPTTQFFTGRMPFLLPKQQRQSTEVFQYELVNSGIYKRIIQSDFWTTVFITVTSTQKYNDAQHN